MSRKFISKNEIVFSQTQIGISSAKKITGNMICATSTAFPNRHLSSLDLALQKATFAPQLIPSHTIPALIIARQLEKTDHAMKYAT